MLTVNDFVGQALTASAAAHFRFPDVAPPTVDMSLSASIPWPPDHKFVDVIATTIAKDNCDPNPTVTLMSITSNEREAGSSVKVITRQI